MFRSDTGKYERLIEVFSQPQASFVNNINELTAPKHTVKEREDDANPLPAI